VEAARALTDQAGARFVLIGDGPVKADLRKSAERLALGNLAFLDARPAEDMPALAAAADIILVPLATDLPGAVPSKLYEAMASGRPLVLIASGEAADIVHRHQAGLVVAPGDATGLVAALRTLLGDSDLRRRLGKNGRRAAVECYDRAKIAACFMDHLETSLRS